MEWPAVYAGEFEREYLAVPAQCISLTMQKNQKYFALMSQRAELLPKYLLVSNLETGSLTISSTAMRACCARLSDAKFFYEQDRKARLDSRVPRLANVVYHNKLGSQLERVQRLEKLAVAIAEQIGSDVRLAERAARLCKADLLTEMVGEFPELQGFMGYYYALHDGKTRRWPVPPSRTISRALPVTGFPVRRPESVWHWQTSSTRWSVSMASASYPPATRIPLACAGRRWVWCASWSKSPCRSILATSCNWRAASSRPASSPRASHRT